MAARRPPRRDEWRRTKTGTWTCSLGQRGQRVQLFQKRKDGVFYRSVWEVGRGRNTASLHTTDRKEAERLGKRLLAALLSGSTGPVDGPVRLGELWRRYEHESAAHLDNTAKTRADTAARARTLLAFFGEDLDVQRLSALDQCRYAAARRAGGIRVSGAFTTRPVRQRSVEADLVVLHQMLGWACTVPTPGGGRWLERNPLAGVRREREKNPLRPVSTWERYEKTRAAMQQLASAARTDAETVRWLKMELALVLAEATGRRLGSIRALCWDDIDFVRQRITWRAEADKKGVEWVVPFPDSLPGELRQFQRRLGALGGLLFPAERDARRPMDRHLFDKWLGIAERTAGLEKLEGSLWHAYRRKWASERKHHALVDVAAAGGWKDTATLLECYQQPDEAALIAVMAEPRKRHEVAAG